MAKQSIYFLLLLLLAACAGNDGVSKPDDLIPADKMADILTEVHLAESQVGRYALRTADSSNMVFNRLNQNIMKKFDVDTSAYRQSYIYYSSHPAEFEQIYKDVTDKLQKFTVSGFSSTTATRPGASTSGTPATTGQAALTTTSTVSTPPPTESAATSSTPASASSSTIRPGFLSRRPIMKKP